MTSTIQSHLEDQIKGKFIEIDTIKIQVNQGPKDSSRIMKKMDYNPMRGILVNSLPELILTKISIKLNEK